MGIGANFGRTVSRTDEPQPDGSVPSRVGVAQLVDRMCGNGKEVGNDFTPRNQCAGSIPATNNPFLKGQA